MRLRMAGMRNTCMQLLAVYSLLWTLQNLRTTCGQDLSLTKKDMHRLKRTFTGDHRSRRMSPFKSVQRQSSSQASVGDEESSGQTTDNTADLSLGRGRRSVFVGRQRSEADSTPPHRIRPRSRWMSSLSAGGDILSDVSVDSFVSPSIMDKQRKMRSLSNVLFISSGSARPSTGHRALGSVLPHPSRKRRTLYHQQDPRNRLSTSSGSARAPAGHKAVVSVMALRASSQPRLSRKRRTLHHQQDPGPDSQGLPRVPSPFDRTPIRETKDLHHQQDPEADSQGLPHVPSPSERTVPIQQQDPEPVFLWLLHVPSVSERPARRRRPRDATHQGPYNSDDNYLLTNSIAKAELSEDADGKNRGSEDDKDVDKDDDNIDKSKGTDDVDGYVNSKTEESRKESLAASLDTQEDLLSLEEDIHPKNGLTLIGPLAIRDRRKRQSNIVSNIIESDSELDDSYLDDEDDEVDLKNVEEEDEGVDLDMFREKRAADNGLETKDRSVQINNDAVILG